MKLFERDSNSFWVYPIIKYTLKIIGAFIGVLLLIHFVYKYIPGWIISEYYENNLENFGSDLKNDIDFNTGIVGDTFGGILSPLVGIMAFIFSIIAIIIQVWSFNKQNQETTRQRFTLQFFELLRYQNKVIDNLSIRTTSRDRISGNDCFQEFFMEIKWFIELFKQLLKTEFEEERKNEILNHKNNLMIIAYSVFYIGTGLASDEMIKIIFQKRTNLSDKEIELIIKFTKRCKYKLKMISTSDETKAGAFNYLLFHENQYDIKKIFPKYKLFDGHINILSACFMNTYLMVRHLNFESNNILEDKEKNTYLEILGSQMSIYQKVILGLNTVCNLDDHLQTEKQSLLETNLFSDIPPELFRLLGIRNFDLKNAPKIITD